MSKGASSKTTTEIPAWLQDDVEANLDRAQEISKIGYTPYRGPTVAAFNPMQTAAMGNIAETAGAAGFDTGSLNIPKPRTFANGVQGYSPMQLFNDARQRTKANTPGQYDAINAQFINPRTGAAPQAASLSGGGTTTNDTKDKTKPYNPDDTAYWWTRG